MLSKKENKQSFYIYMLKNNLTLIGCSLFLFCFLFLLYTVSNFNGIYYYGRQFCLADAYVWFLKPRAYGILVMPFLIIIFINLTKYDDMPYVLIRYKNIRTWMKRKVIIGIILSFAVAMITLLVVTFDTSLQVTSLINWEKEQSVYYIMTQVTNQRIHIGQVILSAFITMFIRNVLLCLITILLTLELRNNILTFLILLAFTIGEMIQKNVPIFYHFITLDYALWENPRLVFYYVIYCLVALLFLGIRLNRVSKYKEWNYEG